METPMRTGINASRRRMMYCAKASSEEIALTI